jgi:hypothetical protein
MYSLAESVWTWSHFFFGLTYALVASFIFLLLILVFLRPYIKISNLIASHIDEFGKPCFRIKFYNCSLFSAHDAVVDLIAVQEIPAQPKGRDILVLQKIELTNSKFPSIPRWIPAFLVKNYAHHCFQIKTYNDLDEILKDRAKSLKMRIVLRHGLTGLSKNFVREFTYRSVVKGEFEFGNSLTVK